MSMQIKLLMALAVYHLTFAQPAKINFNGSKIEINKVCYDNGFVRESNDSLALSAVPVLKKVKLDLGHKESFEKNLFIQSKHRFYNRDTKKYEIAKINKCNISIMSNAEPIVVINKKASAGEAILYGNLKNHGINDIFNEKWRKFNNFETYLRRNGEKARFSLEENLTDKIEDVDLSSFEEWNDFSKKYIGGEQTGGGTGKVRVTLKFSTKELLRARREKSSLNRLFNINTTYENVILKKEALPRSKMFVKKRK